MSWRELEEVLLPRDVKISSYDYCYRHDKNCRRLPTKKRNTNGILNILCAGSPCPDYSNFGKHCGQSGATAPAFMMLIFGMNIGIQYVV